MDWKRTASILVLALSIPEFATASCNGIESQPDHALFYNQDGIWKPAKELGKHLGSAEMRRVAFAFVIKDSNFKDRRRGVVIVKSGFTKSSSSSMKEMNRVALWRPSIKDPCRKRRYPLMEKSITQRTYNDYHDRDIDRGTAEDILLSKFHIYYDSRRGCIDTNDVSPEAYFDGDNRSNRSQFSFDRKRVAFGSIRHAETSAKPNSAHADELIAGRTVQLFKYVVNDRGFACVQFRVMVGPGAFVRVNDLESRTLMKTDSAEWDRGD